MPEVSVVGVDLAKHVFQVHAVDGSGRPVVRRQLRRDQLLAFFQGRPRCLVGRGLRRCPPLGAAIAGDGARGPADAAVVREALRQAWEDGCGRRGGDLRGCYATVDAVRCGEE